MQSSVGGGPILTLPPCSGLVRGQTEESMKEVHPQRCAEFLVHKPNECRQECCKEPEFGSIPAEVGMGVGLQEPQALAYSVRRSRWPGRLQPLAPLHPTVLEVGSGSHHPLHL